MERTICVFHDIEHGLGHRDVDPDFAARTDRIADRFLDEMLAIENSLQVTTTYNVVGCLLPKVREKIAPGGHCLAFHSFDHRIEDNRRGSILFDVLRRILGNRLGGVRGAAQLARCRQLDPVIRGYHPPQDMMTPELTDHNLRNYHFQWLACSMHALKTEVPKIEDGIVKIPIALDDFQLYSRKRDYRDWETEVLARVRHQQFIAVGLHDCYANYWLPFYRSFLAQLKTLGKLKTFDDVAAQFRPQTPR